ncbi:MAG: HAD family phosphatase [Candidatus Omnitrophica bacterium]|nr:HAD family phosphatase [Candidatus Omnitrophota bacterium]
MFKAVIFDIDGTITKPISSWRYLHEKLGKWDVLAYRYQEMFLAGKISYRKFCELDASHWQGLPEREIRRLFSTIPFSKNAAVCLKQIKKAGLRLIGLSTGLQYVAEQVKEKVPFDAIVCNYLMAKDGVLNGEVRINISHGGKGKMVGQLLKPFGLLPQEAIAVGDSDGDVSLARVCGYTIAFNSTSEKLNQLADYVCQTDDLLEVYFHIRQLLSSASHPLSKSIKPKLKQ